jgi:hypothetical protein
MIPTYEAVRRFVKRAYLFPSVSLRPAVVLVALLLWSGPPCVATAQGLPAWAPISPMAASRTPLGFEPYHRPAPDGWSADLALDYASAIEFGAEPGARYDLDTELLRLRLRVRRDLGPSSFVAVDAGLGGSYGGFLDGFLDWYHSLLGISLTERERRPRNAFLYRVELPDGTAVQRRPSDIYLDDVRLSAGIRIGPHLQALGLVTLPTSTASAGYGRGVVSAGVIATVQTAIVAPLIYEGSAGLGYAPTHGELEPYQRTTFVSASSGLRWRFWGGHSLYGNVFLHTPYYHDTTIRGLDRRDMALDFGWMLATRSGREWRVGLTEDLEPGGPGIDLVFRLGALRLP